MIKEIDLKIGDVPVKIFRPENFNENTKTIIHYHGWTSSIDKFISYGKLFSQKGYQVIIPELIHHGNRERINDVIDEIIFLRVVIQSVDEYDIILNYLKTNNLINEGKIILTGHSMGGYIVNILRGIKEDLISAVIYNGIANVFDLSNKEENEINENTEDIKIINRIKELNPLFNYQKYDGKRMFILIGEKDKVVSPNNMPQLQEKLEEAKLDTKNIDLKYFEEADHDISMSMIRSAIKYIDKL